MASQRDSSERRGPRTKQNPIEVEVTDLVRFHQPEAQSIFITANMVSELYNIAKEHRKSFAYLN